MSDIELTKAASDTNFSPTLIEKERQRRRDIKKAPDTFSAASEESQMKSMTDFEKAKATSERRFSVPTPPVLPDRMGGDEGVSPRMTNEEIFKQALQRRDASIDRGGLPERRRQAISAMRENFPATAEEPSLPSDRQLAMQSMQDRTSKLRRTAGDVSSINNALEEGRKIRAEKQRLAEQNSSSVTVPVNPAGTVGVPISQLPTSAVASATSNAPAPAVTPAVTPAEDGNIVEDIEYANANALIEDGNIVEDIENANVALAVSNPISAIAEAKGAGDKTQSETGQNLVKAFEYVNPFRDKFSEAQAKLGEITQKEREELQKQRKSIDQDKWMQLANFGFSILAQPGGQTLLEAVGKGAKESQLVGNLSKLNDKQRALALNASQLDRRELQDELGLTKTQADMYDRERMYDLKVMELEASISAATDKARQNALSRQLELLKFDHQIKKTDAELTSKEQQTRLKILPSTSNEEGLKIYNRQFESFMSDPKKLSGGIRAKLEKFGVIDKGTFFEKFDSFKTDFKEQAFPIFISEYRKILF